MARVCILRVVRVVIALLLVAGCHFQERFRPITPRASMTPVASVTPQRVGYDHTMLSVTVDVENRSEAPLAVDPSHVRLHVGADSAPAMTGLMAGGGDGVARGAIAGGRVGGARGAALGAAGGVIDAVLLTALNEAVRGPYTRGVHHLERGERGQYTIQFPVRYEADDRICVPPYGENDRCATTVSLRDGVRLELGDAGTIELLDTADAHFGLGPPSPPGGVFAFRIGGGPGLGATEAVGGIELAAGPRWGRFAVAATLELGPGFPVGAEAHWHFLDAGLVHFAATLGGAYWFLPDHHAAGPRAGVDLGLDLGERFFGWPSTALQMGLYARGGPTFIGQDAQLGGELDFGVMLGMF
jgi:hypothetical protein